MSARDLFGPKIAGRWTVYEAELQFVDKLIGGVPKDPNVIREWLRARLDIGDRELEEMTTEVATQMAEDLGRRPSAEELTEEVAKKYAQGNGFKRVNGNLVYEGRCLKSGLKEAANTVYPGTDFPGKPAGIRKGLMRYMAERVTVDDLYIDLGVSLPNDGGPPEVRIKHVQTPQGPRSALNVVDWVDKPRISCRISVLDDLLKPEVWGAIWESLEHIGLGADRARSDGRFMLERWEKVA